MPDSRRPTEKISLAPLDNRALANLCGPLDSNLRQIEAALDVAISHRGADFAIAGEPAQAARAATALRRFYADAGNPLSVDDIQLGLVEFGTRSPAAPGEARALRTTTAFRACARDAPTCTAARPTRSRT